MSDAAQTATESSTQAGGDTTAASTTTAAATTTASTTTATEAASTTAATTAATTEATAEAKPTVAPEAYADFSLPEGVQLDSAVMGEFGTLAKELNLSQDQAQKLVDLQAKATAGTAQQLQAAIDKQADQWAADAKSDKEYGGDKFDENLAVSKAALDKFATPEFRAFLEQSKLGNHPEMLRAFYRIGQAVGQDGFVPGRAGGAKGVAQSMYANSNMNP